MCTRSGTCHLAVLAYLRATCCVQIVGFLIMITGTTTYNETVRVPLPSWQYPNPDPEPNPEPNPDPNLDPNPDPNPGPNPDPNPGPNPDRNPNLNPYPDPDRSPSLAPAPTPTPLFRRAWRGGARRRASTTPRSTTS